MIHPCTQQKKILQPTLFPAPSPSDTSSALPAPLLPALCQQSLLPPAQVEALRCCCPSGWRGKETSFYLLKPSSSASGEQEMMMMMAVAEAERRKGNAAAGSFFHPFTPSQLQELHGQAIIFNCMSLGLPVPSHLLISLGRSRAPQPKPDFFPQHHSPLEWGCRQMGSSGREEDSEPGRCRRTDGKKWRCSRAACPDSKYCERHLHRGKNRSRKQMEPSHLHRSIAGASSPCSLSILPSIIQSKRAAHDDLRFCDGGKENGVEQDSSSGTSGLSFQHCFVMGADLRLEGSGKAEKAIPLHCFFDERPEIERRSAGLQSSESQDPMPLPLPPLLDLNV